MAFFKIRKAKVDWTAEMLPRNRKELFFDIFKLHFFNFLYYGLFLLILSFPMHLLALVNDLYESNMFSVVTEMTTKEELTNIFINKNINFEIYKKFKWLGRQSLDFYLPQYNIAIECQGRQHFETVNAFGGEEGFIKTQARDKRKYDLCKEQDVKLLYYTHENYDKFLGEELIKEPQKLIEKILEIKK